MNMRYNDGLALDQLWYTWSTSGLGSMKMDYRVRAASAGLHDIQDIRYRRLDRYLRYELPPDINLSRFEVSHSPISLAFIDNGYERLLIRKVFKGRDAAGRYSVYFSHLIAGLPASFSARDAIRLWDCPSLWRESDEGLASNNTLLEQISYQELLRHIEHANTRFDFTPVREPLAAVLQTTLARQSPARLFTVGQSGLNSALIYGLTHCLPTGLFNGLTFNTYDSNPAECQETIVGTITAAELTGEQFRASLSPDQSVPQSSITPEIVEYTQTILSYLIAGKISKIEQLLKKAEQHNCTTTDDFFELYKRFFRRGPLSLKQLADIVKYPEDSAEEELNDPLVQQEAALLILSHADYWKDEGATLFANALHATPSANTPYEVKVAFTAFVNHIASSTIEAMLQLLYGGVNTIDWDRITHLCSVLITLAHPARNSSTWHDLLTKLAHEPYYAHITSKEMWEIHSWLLRSALLLESTPTVQEMRPWLVITSWDKLDRLLKLEQPKTGQSKTGQLAVQFPPEWKQEAISNVLERSARSLSLPQVAAKIVLAHEEQFLATLATLLHACQRQKTETVVQFFRSMVGLFYSNRIKLLTTLLNTFPQELGVAEQLLSSVPPVSEYQLTVQELDTVLESCHLETLAAYQNSPTLADYIHLYIVNLDPQKVQRMETLQLLERLRAEHSLPPHLTALINHWRVISDFLNNNTSSFSQLEQVRQAQLTIIERVQQIKQAQFAIPNRMQSKGNLNTRQTFAAALVPLLVSRIRHETDLANISAVFGETLTASAWDFLSLMATEASRKQLSLDRLIPYILCGIRIASERSLPQTTLDTYLCTLCSRADSSLLKNIDAVVSLGTWSEPVPRIWKDWRKHEGTSTGSNIPIFGNVFLSQSQLPYATHAAETMNALQNPLLSMSTMDTVQQQAVTSTAAKSAQSAKQYYKYAAYMKEYEHGITSEEYSKMHYILKEVFRYWLHYLQGKATSNIHEAEYRLVDRLHSRLTGPKAGTASTEVAAYLVDDCLINLEISKLIKKEQGLEEYFNMPKRLSALLEDMQTFMGKEDFQSFYGDSSIYQEIDVQRALCVVMRRFIFTNYLENKSGWKKQNIQNWLAGERKKVKVAYFTD